MRPKNLDIIVGNNSRLKIISTLSNKELTATELKNLLDKKLNRTTIFYHLKILERYGFVKSDLMDRTAGPGTSGAKKFKKVNIFKVTKLGNELLNYLRVNNHP